MSKYISNTSTDSRTRTENRLKSFYKKLKANESSKGYSEEERQTLHALCGQNGRSELLLASDLKARLKACRYVEAILKTHRTSAVTQPNYYFVTLFDDRSNTSDRAPIIDLKKLQRKAYETLKKLGLHAFVVIEIQPLMNFPREGKGRTLLVHVHAIAWSNAPIDHQAMESAASSTGRWKSVLGMKTVSIKPINDPEKSLVPVGHYLFKPPHSAKNRMPSKKYHGTFRMMGTIKGYRPDLAMRMFEALSHIEFLNLVFGVGDGTKLRQDFRARMMEWHRNRSDEGVTLPGEFDIWRFWFNLRRKHSDDTYLPFRLIGGGHDMRHVPKHKPKPKRTTGRNMAAARRRIRRKKKGRSSRRPIREKQLNLL